MISTIHGHLPLIVYPTEELPVTMGGRAEICKVRGQALGQYLNVQITLDVNTGELLLMSPDNFVGSFRIGDLIAAHLQNRLAHVAREREEGEHAAQAH
jgi:hypothetical protein